MNQNTKELFIILKREETITSQISEFIQAISSNFLQSDDVEIKEGFEKALKLVKERTHILINKEMDDYERYFSTEEIDELIRFYNSPLGKKLLEFHKIFGLEQKEFAQKWSSEIVEQTLQSTLDKI